MRRIQQLLAARPIADVRYGISTSLNAWITSSAGGF